MKSIPGKIGLIVAFAALQLLRCHATITFQLREQGSGSLHTTVAPGGVVNLEVGAVGIGAEGDISANLDSFTYRIVFPNQLFTLQNNAFQSPFDNAQVPAGFNGSIPWSGLPVLINNAADAGSPGATPLVADIYRTTATTTGTPITAPAGIERLTIQAPVVPGVYNISLNVLEAADSNGSLHTTENGPNFVITVEGGPCTPDIDPPVITLNGLNPLTVECHTPFVDPGATALDLCVVGPVAVNVSGTVDPNTPGNYTLTYSAMDPSGNPSTATRTVQVMDTIRPTIVLNGANPLIVQCHSTFVDPGATATDLCAGSVVVTTSSSVDPNTPGNYVLIYQATDPSVNNAVVTRSVQVVDTTLPTITLNGANPLTVECHATFADPGATATDLCAGALAVSSSGTVDVNTPGTYTLTYTSTDPSGNPASATRNVIVSDTSAPTVTLNGDNPLTVECHAAFTDPGATANDTCAGVLTVTPSGTVDANTPGNYTLTYTASDPSGNTGTATRNVVVVDTTAPVVTLNGADPLEVPCGIPFVDPGATAEDSCDGVLAVTTTGTVDVNTPGNYELTYVATDAALNAARATRTVQVGNCTDELRLTCPPNIVVSIGSESCSAVVSFAEPIPSGGVAPITVASVPPSGSPFPAGSTTVTSTATDASGQTASCTFTVTVQDNQAPTLTCPPDITVTCVGSIPPADFAGGSVSDSCDAAPIVSHVGDVGSGVNPTIVTRTYQALDAAGNPALCNQTITVLSLPGDLNGDCCVDQSDLALIMAQIRGRTGNLIYDMNGDGRLDIADARTLVLRFTNPGGAPCP